MVSFIGDKNYERYPVVIKNHADNTLLILDGYNNESICTIGNDEYTCNIVEDRIGYLTVNQYDIDLYVSMPIKTKLTIVGMQYHDYSHSYKVLYSHHLHKLLQLDDGEKPFLKPSNTSKYPNACYIGVPHDIYGYVANECNYYGETKELRSLINSDDYKNGIIKSEIVRINTSPVIEKNREFIYIDVIIELSPPKENMNVQEKMCKTKMV